MVDVQTYERKLESAVEWLGRRWVLHPARRIQKLDRPLKSRGADLAETFKRIQKGIRP